MLLWMSCMLEWMSNYDFMNYFHVKQKKFNVTSGTAFLFLLNVLLI